jgi:hypothetical protein
MSNPPSVRHTYRIEPVWDDLPKHTNTLVGIPRDRSRLRFLREKNSHRGLREFEQLKQLVIFCPNQEAILEIGHLRGLEFLYIDETRATDLSPLCGCRSLRHLIIKNATQVDNIQWIRHLPPLDSLLIENFKKITDISPIASLTAARAIGVEGSMWTRQKVDSFCPLSAIQGLEALFIMNCKPARGGLYSLHVLRNLRYLEAPGFYSEDEFLALERALPGLKCSWFEQIRQHGTIKAAINASINTND